MKQIILIVFLIDKALLQKPSSAAEVIAFSIVIASFIVTLLTIIEKLANKKGPFRRLSGYVLDWFVAPFSVQKQMSVLLTKIEQIEKEVKNNGGGSIKDSIQRVEKSVCETQVCVSEIILNQKAAAERRKTEYDLNQSPIFIKDASNNLVYINQAWCDMVGCKNPMEMMGKGWLRVMPEEFRDELEKQSERIHKNPVPFSGEVVFRHLITGKEIETYCMSKPIIVEGKLIEIIGTLKILADKQI